MSSRIEQFGWPHAEAGVGRVVSAHGDYYHLVCDEAPGEILARKKKSAFRGADIVTPLTGDFVRLRYNAQGESLITDVLPRSSWFVRRDPTARRKAQTLAVNFDTLFIMMSLNENLSCARLERYLTLAEDIGRADVAVVLTKADLLTASGAQAAERLAEVREQLRTRGEPSPALLVISAKTGEGMEAVRARAQPGRTLAFIGSSGVGKSTLLNALAGEEWMATQDIQEWSGKGRHTTTSRELVMLPNGAMIIDTPGIREIGRVGEEESVLAKGVSSHRWRAKEGL